MDIKFEIKGKTLDPEVQEAVDKLAASVYYWQERAEKAEKRLEWQPMDQLDLSDSDYFLAHVRIPGVGNFPGVDVVTRVFAADPHPHYGLYIADYQNLRLDKSDMVGWMPLPKVE